MKPGKKKIRLAKRIQAEATVRNLGSEKGKAYRRPGSNTR